MTLASRVRDLEARAIGAAAEQRRFAARLDALEAAIGGLVTLMHQAGQLERLWTCPRCGFLATRAGLCGNCSKAFLEELEESIDREKFSTVAIGNP